MARAALYLDHNATTAIRPEAQAAMLEALAAPANPSSVHAFGRAARARMQAARTQVAGLVGAEPGEVVFTSGGTEANNLALLQAPVSSVIVSALEHDSILAPAGWLAESGSLESGPLGSGRPVFTCPAMGDGRIDLAALADLLERAPRPALLALMAANNETGVIQPLAEAAALVRAAGGMMLVDAVQAAGKIPLDFARLGIEMMSLSAHKLGGPTGVGALVLRGDIALSGRQIGGGQELGRRAGTENLPGIAGFGVAAAAARSVNDRIANLRVLRDDLERGIRDIAPEAPIYGMEAPRLANTSCIGMPGVKGETQVMAFDLAGFAVSAGSACSSGKVTASAVLGAMGAAPAAAGEAIRVSLGPGNEAADVARFVAAWRDMYERARRLKAA